MAIELNYIVNNEESFEKFKKAVEEGVAILQRIDNAKQDLKDIAETLKEDLDVAPRDFNAVVKHTYKNQIAEELEALSLIEFVVNKINGED